ncbi:unnamed protein product [Cyprideis torosa]|uniref:Pecanex-like protein n=1 Tax=Cyprideis torosa TaxID=163714 RepID=A0A7R8ZPC5_9CRUS|nr:unnamed protein product [Cyprideis torosa]CAG0888099.1 unnamed protein product [Cyprideis torosa]
MPPLINEYKDTFITQQCFQTFLGGLSLMSPSVEAIAHYWCVIATCRVIVFFMPAIIGTVMMKNFGAADTDPLVRMGVTALAYFSLAFPLHVISVVLNLSRRRSSAVGDSSQPPLPPPAGDQPPTRPHGLKKEANAGGSVLKEVYFSVVPPRPSVLHSLVAPLLGAAVLAIATHVLSVNRIQQDTGFETGLCSLLVLTGWLDVALALHPLLGTPSREPSVFRSHDPFELEMFQRSIHLGAILGLHFVLLRFLYFPYLILFIPLLPVLWVMGTLPPLEALLHWIIEELLSLSGGTPRLEILSAAIDLIMTFGSCVTLAFLLWHLSPAPSVSVVCGSLASIALVLSRDVFVHPCAVFRLRIWSTSVPITLCAFLLPALPPLSLPPLSLSLLLLRVTLSALCTRPFLFSLCRNPAFCALSRCLGSLHSKSLVYRSLKLYADVEAFVLLWVVVSLQLQHPQPIISATDDPIWQDKLQAFWDLSILTSLLLILSQVKTESRSVVFLLDNPFILLLLVGVLRERLLGVVHKTGFAAALTLAALLHRKQRKSYMGRVVCESSSISLKRTTADWKTYEQPSEELRNTYCEDCILQDVPVTDATPMYIRVSLASVTHRPRRFWPLIYQPLPLARPHKNSPLRLSLPVRTVPDSIYYQQSLHKLTEHLRILCEFIGIRSGDHFLLRFEDRLVWVSVEEASSSAHLMLTWKGKESSHHLMLTWKGLELQATSCHAVEASVLDSIGENASKRATGCLCCRSESRVDLTRPRLGSESLPGLSSESTPGPLRNRDPEQQDTGPCLNQHFLYAGEPCGSFTVSVHTSARNVLTGLGLVEGAAGGLLHRYFLRAFLWLIVKRYCAAKEAQARADEKDAKAEEDDDVKSKKASRPLKETPLRAVAPPSPVELSAKSTPSSQGSGPVIGGRLVLPPIAKPSNVEPAKNNWVENEVLGFRIPTPSELPILVPFEFQVPFGFLTSSLLLIPVPFEFQTQVPFQFLISSLLLIPAPFEFQTQVPFQFLISSLLLIPAPFEFQTQVPFQFLIRRDED